MTPTIYTYHHGVNQLLVYDHAFNTADEVHISNLDTLDWITARLKWMKCTKLTLKLRGLALYNIPISTGLPEFLTAVWQSNLHILSIINYKLPLQVMYDWLKRDCQLVELELFVNRIDLKKLKDAVEYHPRLRLLTARDDSNDDWPTLYRHRVLEPRRKPIRMVQLLAEPPVPKDILRHIYCFIK
jgi:hypothetical protein